MDRRFGKNKRLLTAHHYSNVFDAPDARASHQHLLILAKRNDEPCHRLGLVIAKKNVKLAAQRNRIKRLIRESFRTLSDADFNDKASGEAHVESSHVEQPHLDMVVMARRGIGELDNAQLSSILQQQWRKLLRQTAKPSTT